MQTDGVPSEAYLVVQRHREWGSRVAQSVKGPTLGFRWGHDLRAMRRSLDTRLRTQWGICWRFSPLLSLPPLQHVHTLSQKIKITVSYVFFYQCENALPTYCFEFTFLQESNTNEKVQKTGK